MTNRPYLALRPVDSDHLHQTIALMSLVDDHTHYEIKWTSVKSWEIRSKGEDDHAQRESLRSLRESLEKASNYSIHTALL